jgi:hypothetical protein
MLDFVLDHRIFGAETPPFRAGRKRHPLEFDNLYGVYLR